MAVATLTPTYISVRNDKPTYVYGATATVPLQSFQRAALLRVGMPSDIPANATVVSAIVTLEQQGAISGSYALNLQRHSVGWATSKVCWNNRPGVSGTAVTVTQSGTPDKTLWSFNVTADVQAFLAGTVVNYGWRVSSNTGTSMNTRGSSAAVGQPKLVITYLTPTDAPIGLVPTGNQAVSLAKPWMTFQAPPDTQYVNVQIDADATSPYDFDSGDVAATAGLFDSSTAAAWAGLVDGGVSQYWRARTKSSFGYSAFSTWAQMRRVAKPTVTITSPGATSDDTTPPVVWSVVGTQTAWQVIITNAAGKLVANSGQIVGTDTTWTPPKAVATDGQTATVEVRIWDNVDRVATSGDPVFARATQTFTVAGVGSVAPATSVTATPNKIMPVVTITATRGTAPDSWQVWRDGKQLAAGLAHPLSYEDWTADPNKPHVYAAVPYITGTGRGLTSGVPTATIVPSCRGIWLVDASAPSNRAVIWGDDGGDFDATELAVIHQPIAGPPVRRVAYRPPLSGSINGELIDVGSMTADAQIAKLYSFKGDDRDLRLVVGDRNLLVRIGDLTIRPTPDSNSVTRHSLVTFTWWQQDDPPWSP